MKGLTAASVAAALALAAGAARSEPPDVATDQVSTARGTGGAPIVVDQIAPAGRTVSAGQIAQGRPTAQPPAPLSTARDSRNLAAAPVAGHDRCDPRDPDAAKAEACRNRMETRPQDFAGPAPTPPTPEQRLLSGQRAAVGPAADARLAARQLATGEVDDSLAAQAAAAAQQHPYLDGADPEAPKPQRSPADQAAIDAVLKTMGQWPSR